MRMISIAAIAVGTALAGSLPWSAGAEPVRITNIGHGYYSGALYIAKQEKLFEKHGSSPTFPTSRAARSRCRRRSPSRPTSAS